MQQKNSLRLHVHEKSELAENETIIVRLDEVMANRKIRLNELANIVGITEANISILKTGKAKAIRFSTLLALCKALNCQPGDILEYRKGFYD